MKKSLLSIFNTKPETKKEKGSLSKTPIFIFNSLNVKRGGLTKAVMKKANIFSEKSDDVTFLTFLYQRTHKNIIEELHQTNKLDRKVRVFNLFLDLDPWKNEKNSSKKVHEGMEIEEKGFIKFEDVKAKNLSYRYYQDGMYKKYKKFDKNKKIMYIDYMTDSRQRTHREEFDSTGRLLRIRHFDIYTNKPRLDRYFSRNGKCFLTTWINPDNESLGRCQLFAPAPMEFLKFDDLAVYWVNMKLKEFKNPALFCDSRKMDNITIKAKAKNLTRYATVHNNHFSAPYTVGAPIKGSFKTLFANIDKYDKIIFLTNEQKQDVIDELGYHENFDVIHHEASKLDDSRLTEKSLDSYNPYLAVSLTRYNSQKSLDEAIHAFKFVLEQLPEAKYHIFGFGEDEAKLQKVINKLGIQESVVLKGFSNDPVADYQKAACSVLSSNYEGSPLAVNESLAAGVPIVTYQMKYGPKDVIRNNVDGFLVDRGDRQELAKKIVEVMKSPNLRKKLSRNAMEIVDRFSEEKFRKAWFSLVE
ncbi:glycosyltransferase [Planococcus sp. YIM B11945]|uniref:glycosyltransferase n=1 Tax=Planococcus sp. YIM B11945 TaxID=3435410 RepID=UPI003D7DB061